MQIGGSKFVQKVGQFSEKNYKIRKSLNLTHKYAASALHLVCACLNEVDYR